MSQSTFQPLEKIQDQKAVLLVNSGSRVGKESFEQSRRALQDHGIVLQLASRYTKVNHLIRDAAQAVNQGIPLVVVGGGDGTISAVAGLLTHSRSALGIIPLGTGNAFAHDLKIPMSISGACDVIVGGCTAEVDLGKIESRYFANIATIGLTTEIAQQLTNPMKKLWGRFAYLIAIIRGIRHLKPLRARLTTENGTNEFECMQLVIGNGRFHAGPFPVLPDASLRGGKFSIYALTGNRRSELIKYAFMLPGGHHALLSEVYSEYAQKGSLHTYPSTRVTVDGEIACRTPIRFETIPRALRILVPPEFDC